MSSSSLRRNLPAVQNAIAQTRTYMWIQTRFWKEKLLEKSVIHGPYFSKSLHLWHPWWLPSFLSTSSPSLFQILRNKTHKGVPSFPSYFVLLSVVTLLPATRPCLPCCRSYPSYWGQALKFRRVKATTNEAEAELCNVTPWSPGFRSKLPYYAIKNFFFSC